MSSEIEKLLEETIKHLQNLQILGDKDWKVQRAREIEHDLKSALRKLQKEKK